jgi:hypothetical protein
MRLIRWTSLVFHPPKMRFFTSRWHGGEISDAESDAVVTAYKAHIGSIAEQLPPALREYSQRLSIHDALLQSCRIDDAGGTLELTLIVGDREVGYSDLRLSYGGVALAHADRQALSMIARNPEAEALYDEIDLSRDGAFIHRWLWWPYTEVDIQFAGFAYAVTPRPRDRALEGEARAGSTPES